MFLHSRSALLPILLTLTLSSASPQSSAGSENSRIEAQLSLGPETYTASGIFPTSLFLSYWNEPTQTVSQVQPVVTDLVFNTTYPLDLTSPDKIPNDTSTKDNYPATTLEGEEADKLYESVLADVQSIIAGSEEGDSRSNCTKCTDAMVSAGSLTKQAPRLIPKLLVNLCNDYEFGSTDDCLRYSQNSNGPYYAQVLAYADLSGSDGQFLCHQFLGVSKCEKPPLPKFDASEFWSKPKPSNVVLPESKGTNRIKVLHISNLHLDPRYATGSEANCTSGTCCRNDNPVEALQAGFQPSVSAPRFGYFSCDTPWSLAAAAVQAIPVLTGTDAAEDGADVFNMTIFTGDIVSHGPLYQESQEYVMYTEAAVYDLWKRTLNPSSPMYAAIGNHDSYASDFDSPNTLPGEVKEQFTWNYEHLSSLWRHNDWIDDKAAQQAKAHYGGYSIQHAKNLKIITLNTDLWYKTNVFAYINSSKSDNFGFLRFLASELQEAEDCGSRVYIVGHVLSGWDGTNALPGPTDAFYQIVDRYSQTIAAIFWGHSHEDQHLVYYSQNGTEISVENAQNVAWIAPSLTPSQDMNSGFRMYEVDADTWEILDAHTWYSNVSTYSDLDGQLENGPIYEYEYNTREAYGAAIDWPENASLNATWWHRVTEQMELDNGELVQLYNAHQGKKSIRTPNCTSTECVQAKICYIRSGSTPLALENCIPDFGSVQ
ncbi:uncharacterized protein I303_104278 [Kwoniella dejecticola CBS 10117]|uniref:Ser/Thr protein phosphatase n=1 Tax=Kwoniella dejecticola CBS 10117 TaxID=1296121 RepID=A0A1A6A5S3_9TREE|nr:Ser/Thr protein phosphatase [Kwoniella dejecticola CBS 10117]OBR85410.1 Ser/Thr protein phosphatase [Kwoniella dejecticola CBS 10117]